LNKLDEDRDEAFLKVCRGFSSSLACAGMSRDMLDTLATYATSEARTAALNDKNSPLTQEHRNELQSYLELLMTRNPDVKSSDSPYVRNPGNYDADPYRVVDSYKPGLYFVMKFGNEALVIAVSVNKDGEYYFEPWAAHNGMDNPPGYGAGLMLVHTDAAAKTRDGNNSFVDSYTLSYAPTMGFTRDVIDTAATKFGKDNEAVLELRKQLEAVQGGDEKVNWVAHSRGGAEFMQAASGSGMIDLGKNSAVFHAGANNSLVTKQVMEDKNIGDVIGDKDSRYRDSPYDAVPQIVGLRAVSSEGSLLNIITSVLGFPCLFLCSVENSPHTLPYKYDFLVP